MRDAKEAIDRARHEAVGADDVMSARLTAIIDAIDVVNSELAAQTDAIADRQANGVRRDHLVELPLVNIAHLRGLISKAAQLPWPDPGSSDAIHGRDNLRLAYAAVNVLPALLDRLEAKG